ncbi:MAG TPA: glycosyltransferase family 2 protein [Streptosporangiaceae bacterium]|nr:glycosyltransferase family 2 protein [Streptosporangiaceae bacterium]
MRLIILTALAVCLVAVLAGIALLGGRGDRGDGLRRVDLPKPAPHLGRPLVLVLVVVLAGVGLTAENGVVSQVLWACVSRLARAGGMSASQAAGYVPEVHPLLPALVVVCLLAFHLVRKAGVYARAVGTAVTGLTGVALLVALSAADALAAAVHLPATIVVYLVSLTSLFVGLFGFMAGLFRTSMLPRRYRRLPVVSGLGQGLMMTFAACVALVAGAVVFRAVASLLQPTFAGAALLVFLVVPATLSFFQLLLFVFRRREQPGRPAEAYPPLDVIVACYNEEEQITAALRGIDRAAEMYPGRVRVLVADDGSTDLTVSLVEAAAREARAAHIELCLGAHGGKSVALNRALEYSNTEIVVCIDADILVEPGVFVPLPGWFANPNVGCVGAFVLPNPALTAWYTKGRLFECLYTFGFCRLAYERLDGNNIPGTFMALRRRAALAVGGYVQGMNGEDSDMTFNLGRLGLVSVIDRSVVIYEDVPQDLNEFIKQRTRWSRASLHIASRHLPRSASEYTGRYAIQLRFVFSKLSTLLRPVTFIGGAVLVLSDHRPAVMVTRGLILLTLGFLPQLGMQGIVAVLYGYWRELPWLLILFPFTVARKIAALNGVLSVPAFSPRTASSPRREVPVAEVVQA